MDTIGSVTGVERKVRAVDTGGCGDIGKNHCYACGRCEEDYGYNTCLDTPLEIDEGAIEKLLDTAEDEFCAKECKHRSMDDWSHDCERNCLFTYTMIAHIVAKAIRKGEIIGGGRG